MSEQLKNIPPTPELLHELVLVGTLSAMRQNELRLHSSNPDVKFFLPREIDGYTTGELPYDDYYWTQRYIGRIGIKAGGVSSLRLKESATTINDLIGFTDKERVFYCFEWSQAEVIEAHKYDVYAEHCLIQPTAKLAEGRKENWLLLDTDGNPELESWKPEPVSYFECALLLERLQAFSTASISMHHRSLGMRQETPGRVGINVSFEQAIAAHREADD